MRAKHSGGVVMPAVMPSRVLAVSENIIVSYRAQPSRSELRNISFHKFLNRPAAFEGSQHR